MAQIDIKPYFFSRSLCAFKSLCVCVCVQCLARQTKSQEKKFADARWSLDHKLQFKMFYVFGISKFECNYRNIKRDVFGHCRRSAHSVRSIRVCRPSRKRQQNFERKNFSYYCYYFGIRIIVVGSASASRMCQILALKRDKNKYLLNWELWCPSLWGTNSNNALASVPTTK